MESQQGEINIKILVTGGAGFIGSNFIPHILKKYKDYSVVNLDKLTYAGNLNNLKIVETDPNYSFIRGDICDADIVKTAMKDCDIVVNFAAETHVDRSIVNPENFIKTNVVGTHTLLEQAKKQNIKKFIQISTDEVYGSIEAESFKETDTPNPSNPYSASKASADLITNSYRKNFNMPTIIIRSSNNFGPHQYPEKLIPLLITNLLENKKIPLYGDGLHIREWIYVLDNCEAIDFILHNGKLGEIYNVSSTNENTNLDIANMILAELGKDKTFIEHVRDRMNHDRRYSLNCQKINKLGWKPKFKPKHALKSTIAWYIDNKEWWKKVKSREYLDYYEKHYKEKHGMKG